MNKDIDEQKTRKTTLLVKTNGNSEYDFRI